MAVEILVGEEMKLQIRRVEIVPCDHYISDVTFCDNEYQGDLILELVQYK